MNAGTSRPEWQVYKDVKRSNYTKTGRYYLTTVREIQPPYGDEPRDQEWIKSGFKYYKNGSKNIKP